MLTRTTSDFLALRAATRTILDTWETRDWSVQGFGMLRCYYSGPGDDPKKYRLNIWDSELAVAHVSTLHDHPWDFTSWIIAGKFKNVRYLQTRANVAFTYAPVVNCADGLYDFMRIKTGEGGGPAGEVQTVHLIAANPEVYGPGDIYQQVADEIHASFYLEDGTVTLNDRKRREDGEHARVFWPHGEKWIDAEPRAATGQEIMRTILKAQALFARDDETLRAAA